jgi:hypothetical protein
VVDKPQGEMLFRLDGIAVKGLVPSADGIRGRDPSCLNNPRTASGYVPHASPRRLVSDSVPWEQEGVKGWSLGLTYPAYPE